MDFYFCGQYIDTDVDPKAVKHDMYKAVLDFRGFDDRMVMKFGRAILKLSSGILI